MLLKGQGVSLSGSYQVQWAWHYTLNLYSSSAAKSKTMKMKQQSDFRAPDVVTVFILSVVWPVRALIMSHVIVWMLLSGSTLQDLGGKPVLSARLSRPRKWQSSLCFPAVPTLPQEGCKQTSDHAAATEAVQEPDHPGLQDAGPGTHQHGGGIMFSVISAAASISSAFIKVILNKPEILIAFWQED